MSGLNHFQNIGKMSGYAGSKNVPFPRLAVIGSGRRVRPSLGRTAPAPRRPLHQLRDRRATRPTARRFPGRHAGQAPPAQGTVRPRQRLQPELPYPSHPARRTVRSAAVRGQAKNGVSVNTSKVNTSKVNESAPMIVRLVQGSLMAGHGAQNLSLMPFIGYPR
jgi:hypothetical protein